MTLQPAGTEVSYAVTYLEMVEAPGWGYPHAPSGPPAALLKADAPPAWYFLALYDAVGRDYVWEDAHDRDPSELAAWLNHSSVSLHTLMSEGWPKGFFVLDGRDEGEVDIAYFGLVPEAVGRGLGGFLLKTAVRMAWDLPGSRLLKVNTCTLDHPRALQMYQKHGFSAVRREDRVRVLRRPRDLSRVPD